MKNVSRHQHDKNRYSRIATVDSCFVLFGTRQHCVTKICNASQTANAHIINCRMTRSLYQVPYFELTCAPKHELPHPMFRGARRRPLRSSPLPNPLYRVILKVRLPLMPCGFRDYSTHLRSGIYTCKMPKC